jgi:hypothetical protein
MTYIINAIYFYIFLPRKRTSIVGLYTSSSKDNLLKVSLFLVRESLVSTCSLNITSLSIINIESKATIKLFYTINKRVLRLGL